MAPGFLRRIAIAGLVWAIVPSSSHAQYPGELSGRITDAITGAPIDNVLVEVLGTGLTTVTDGRGEFRISGLEPGRQSVRISRLGYATLEREIEIENGVETRLFLRLGVQPVQLAELAVDARAAATAGALRIARDEIERMGAQTAADALEGRAGLVVNTRGPTGPRGVSIRGGAADQVLVLLDGVPLNDPLTGVADLSTVPASQIESITVLRGSQSARYGPGAEAGAIVIETRTAAATASLRAGIGSLGTWVGGLEAGSQIGGSRWSAGGAVRTMDGRYEYRRPEQIGGDVATRLNGDLTEGDFFLTGHGPLADGRLRVRAGHTRLERGLPGLSFLPAPEAREEFTRWRGQASWERLHRGTRISAQLHGASQSARFRDRAPPVGPPFDSRTDARTFGGRLWVDVDRAGTVHSISGGLEARHQRYESTALDSSAPRGLFNFGAFAATEVGLGRSQTAPRLSAALRLDRDDLDRTWYLTHELTAKARIGSVRLHARQASSYRPPSFGDQFFKEGVMVEPNPELRPERIPSEIDLGASIEGRVSGVASGRLSAEGYIADVTDMIIWAPDFRFVWSPRNFDVNRRGLDLEGELAFGGESLQLRAGYSHARATYDRPDDDDVQVIYRPRHSGFLGASWRPDRWQLGADLRYIGTRYPVPAHINALDPFWTLDLRVRRSFTFGSWQFTPALYVDRVLDNDDALIFGYPEAGRVLRLEVTAGPGGGVISDR